MKVFWSWQSDHLGKISRHFVRAALEEAITALNAEPEINEADRPEIELDHDRKGVPGSPDLASTILNKIAASQVFVADVTPVGKVVGTSKKRLMNANVAIELGYALSSIGDARLIMIMNAAYGNRGDLPFDLSHKAGPIFYDLPATAEPTVIATAKAQLTGALKVAIREIISSQSAPGPAFQEHTALDGDPSRFVPAGSALAIRSRATPDEIMFLTAPGPQLYLRLIPKTSQSPLKRADLKLLARGYGGKAALEPFYHSPTSVLYEANAEGLLTFDHDGGGQIAHGVELFLSRELWAFDSTVLSFHDGQKQGVPTKSAEGVFTRCLPIYLRFMKETLQVDPPYTIEAGACGVAGYRLYYTSHQNPILHDDCVSVRRLLRTTDDGAVDGFLLELFEAFFDAAAVKRPQGLYGFPPNGAPR